MFAQVQYSSGSNLTMDPAIMISNWKFTKQPVRRKRSLETKIQKLCEVLDKIPWLTVRCEKEPVSAEEFILNKERLEQVLELVRSNLFFLNGSTIQGILSRARVYVPKLSGHLQFAVEGARERLVEAEQALMYALDIVPENESEWLPGPPEPGSFPKGQDAIPFNQI